MKRLLLLRHAKAMPAEGAAADIARPLAERGQRDARRSAERLRQQGAPRSILASPATRTLETAEVVREVLGLPRDSLVVERNLYLAEPGELLGAIAAQDAGLESLLVVGHNPGLTELAQRLLPSFDVDNLPTCAIVGLDYPAGTEWRRLESAAARLAYYDFPKNRREPFTAR
jgi:phosphohistidine phosphatase